MNTNTQISAHTPDSEESNQPSRFNLRNVLILIGIFLLSCAAASYIYLCYVQPASEKLIVIDTISGATTIPSIPLEDNQQIEQPFYNEESFNSLRVQFGTYQSTLQDITFTCQIFDQRTGGLLSESSAVIAVLEDNSWVTFDFDRAIHPDDDGMLVSLEVSGLTETSMLSAWLSDAEQPSCKIAQQSQPGTLKMEVMGYSDFLADYFLIISIPLILLLPLLWYLIFMKRAKIHNIFLIAALGFGMLNMLVYTPYSSYDESHHIPTSFYYSSALLGSERLTQSDGTKVWQNRAEDTMAGLTNTRPTISTYFYQYSHFFELAEHPEETVQTTIKVNGQPYQYAPQTLGVTVARILDLGQVPTLYMGKLFNLLFFIMLMYVTIRLVPFKSLFCLLGLMPFILSASGSFSYDTAINALALFFIGYTFYLTYSKQSFSWKDGLILALTGILLAPLKYIYFPILFLPLIVPLNKWRKPVHKWFWCIGIALLGALSILYFSSSMLNYVNTGISTLSGMTPWGQPGYTYSYLFAHPTELIRLLLSSAIDNSGSLVSGIGTIQHINLPTWVNLTVAALFVLSVASSSLHSTIKVKRSDKVISLLISLSVYALALVAALPWTSLGALNIAGAQARYFIPIFPLLILLTYGLLSRKSVNDNLLIFMICAINVYCIYYQFAYVAFN